MTLLDQQEDLTVESRRMPRGPAEPRARRRAGRIVGGFLSAAGLLCWLGWLRWRIAHVTLSFVSVAELVLELMAFAAALVLSLGLGIARPGSRRDRRATDRDRPLPVLIADAFDLGDVVNEAVNELHVGRDDTGEIAWARRGIRVLGSQRRTSLCVGSMLEAAWSVVAVEGLRRLASIVVLLVVLFSGATPFMMPSLAVASLLAVGLALVAVGHWLLSAGNVRPGARLVWSMSSVGAGLGDGVSRSGLPIRWMVTMAAVVTMNIAVALRGMSDRWTHGLGPMEHDDRVLAMSLAMALVVVGGLALRRMPRPDLGFYGATRRLEEDSARRLALGLTLAAAIVGFVAGTLPAEAVQAVQSVVAVR